MVFDCHSHTQFAGFKEDYKEVITRALKEGVGLINAGTQITTSKDAVRVAHEFENDPVYAAVGLHPTHTTKSYHDEKELGGGEAAKAFVSRGEVFDYDAYHALAKDEKVVAIGECGLDYYRLEDADAEALITKQEVALAGQIELAEAVGKALMLHCRPRRGTDDAYYDLMTQIEKHSVSIPKVLHFYVGSPEVTKVFLEKGYYFEFGGVITFARDYDASIAEIPLERIVLETDAPYVAPAPHRGKRNEPVYVKEVAKKLAELKDVSYEEVCEVTTKTAKEIFKLP